MKVKELIFIQFLSFMLILFLVSCKNVKTVNQKPSIESVPCQIGSESALTKGMEDGFFEAHKTSLPIQINGCSKDAIWSNLDWYGINYLWMGSKVDSIDYHGRFKLAWDSQYLYWLK